MAGPIGFHAKDPTPDQPEEKTTPSMPLEEIDSAFQGMIRELKVEEHFLSDQLKMDQQIRQEIVSLYAKFKEIEDKVQTRRILMSHCRAKMNDFPKECIEMLKEIDTYDDQILKETQELFNSISKHQLHEVAEIYKKVQLSTDETKRITSIANMLSDLLSEISGPIRRSFDGQETEMMRRNIAVRMKG